MDLAVFIAMLASAFLHAAWNAWVKARKEPSEAMAALLIGAGVPNLVLLCVAGLPAAPAWAWMSVTVTLTIIALSLLGPAYREGDFAVAYPMIRGLIPIVLVLAAIPLFGERPTPEGTVGVVCVSAGLGVIAWESARRTRTMTLRGLGLAALAAGIMAISVITDAKGARLSGNPLGYAAAIAVLNALLMTAVRAAKGDNVPAMLRRQWPIATFGTMLSISSYVLFIWSVTRAPVAMVATLRETSMLFALVIAAFALRERIGRYRLGAVLLMLAGAALIRLSSK